MIPNVYSEYSEHYFRDRQRVISKSTYPIAWYYYNLLPSQWLAIWRIFRRSPLSEDKYPNRNPAWKQALLIIDFQGKWFTYGTPIDFDATGRCQTRSPLGGARP